MLKKTNSYFLKIIFFHINEGKKLDIVKYNKKLQKKIDIGITNYKIFSGKYIVHENNGTKEISKIYNAYTDQLIFEGEFSNGKINGKGKLYDDNGDLFFEGEFINGKKNGKGKEYFPDGRVIFEGEYLNGKRWNIKGYDFNGNIICELKEGKGFIIEALSTFSLFGFLIIYYECEYLNGEKNGKGKEYNNEGKLLFEGDYLDGKRWNGKTYNINKTIITELKEGKGYLKEFYGDYLVGEGEYLYGLKNGKGKEYGPLGKLLFEGEYLNNQRSGKGIEYGFFGDTKFEGEYKYGQKIQGKQFIGDRIEFEGEYLYNAKWDGKGYDENGRIIYELTNGKGKVKEYTFGCLEFEGEYINGKKNGKGKDYFYDGRLLFEGEYLNGKRWNGKGKELYIDGNMRFEGDYLNGKKWNGKELLYNNLNEFIEIEYLNGKEKGKQYYMNGNLMFEGEYLNGIRNGKGIEYYENGKIKFKGIFLNGMRNGKGKEYNENGKIQYKGEYLDGNRIPNH